MLVLLSTRQRVSATRRVLETEPPPVELAPAVRRHWIQETGYSFPSGHSFAAVFFATFFLAMGVSYTRAPRVWLFYLDSCNLTIQVHFPTAASWPVPDGVVLA